MSETQVVEERSTTEIEKDKTVRIKNTQEKNKEIKAKRLESLLQRQREKDEKMKRLRQKKIALTEEEVKLGGLWKTSEEVDEKMNALPKPHQTEAVKFQLQFHKKVLRSEEL
ncbi:Hypp9476 [Branchiostoma lanceolatum]|uniref:Hypp9476 protein n=1 Tax=Branchiostoma lanceolatum TaxID=7740 RepID=A0A8S4MNB1_BRALA|nr:Hypp9476 [Branchiostoma lanceolatum]